MKIQDLESLGELIAADAMVAPAGVRNYWDEGNGRLGAYPDVREWIDRRLGDTGDSATPSAPFRWTRLR